MVVYLKRTVGLTFMVMTIVLCNVYGSIFAKAYDIDLSLPKKDLMISSSVNVAGENDQFARSHREKRGRRGNKRRDRMDSSDRRRGKSPKPCTVCEKIESFVPMSDISEAVRVMVGKSWMIDKTKAVKILKLRGAVETGLVPDFIGGANCPEIDSEKWAIDYSHKRSGAAIHKGIDIPQPHGTAVLAVASGTVVGKFKNRRNRKGIEVMIRHTPEQTALPFWTYSQYTHLLEMSPLSIGQSVKMGQQVGKTSNSGKMGRRIRRDALHFAILYSKHPEWSNDGRFVTP